MSELIAKASMETMFEGIPAKNVHWQEPAIYDLSSEDGASAVRDLVAHDAISTVHDPVTYIANDLYDLHHPDEKKDAGKRADYIHEITELGTAFGNWVYFPWSRELVRYPTEDDHRALHTSRNRNLITDAEQSHLYDARIAVFGLSVGSSIVERMVASGVGGTIIMGDPDHIEPSNLNRINGTFLDVGSKKIDRMARHVSQVDPYIDQVHFANGAHKDMFEDLAGHAPDIIFDEVDHLPSKAALRLFAREQRIPLIMATDLGDTSLIDVERYDVGDAKPFNGKIKTSQVEQMAEGRLTPQELGKATIKIVGIKHTTARMLQSVMVQGKELPGLPQLGNTATVGGALATTAAREIILGRDLPSGRYVSSPKEILKLSSPDSRMVGIRTLMEFVRFQKANKTA